MVNDPNRPNGPQTLLDVRHQVAVNEIFVAMHGSIVFHDRALFGDVLERHHQTIRVLFGEPKRFEESGLSAIVRVRLVQQVIDNFVVADDGQSRVWETHVVAAESRLPDRAEARYMGDKIASLSPAERRSPD